MSEIHRLKLPDETPIAASIEAEQMVLGLLLLQNDHIPETIQKGGESLFYDPVHAAIFESIRERHSQNALASPITIADALRGHEGLAGLGGGGYLVKLAAASISGYALPGFLKLLADWRRKRELLDAMGRANREIMREDVAADDVAARLEAAIMSSQPAGRDGPVSMLAAVTGAMTQIKAAYEGDEGRAVKTGIYALDKIIGAMFPGDLVYLGGRPSMGKAQPLTSRILTHEGWKAMGDIKLGDKLASVDGKPSSISGIFPQGERQVFRITFSDGRTVRACGEHLWAVESSKFKGRKVWSTDQIREAITRERYKRRLSVPLVSGDFGGGSMPVDPWLLGALIGNGNLTNSQPRISTADARTLWRVQSALSDEQSLRASGGYDYAISGKGNVNVLTAALRDMGLMGCSSLEKFIPAQYMHASRADRFELLRGLMDTDGWVEKFGAVRYSTSSQRLAEDVANLVRSLGGVCSINSKSPSYTYKGEKLAGETHFVLNIRHPEPSSFFSLHRKARLATRSKPVRLTIVSVEPDGFEPVQCISVTHPSRLYVTDGYTATHNTALALSIALNVARNGNHVAIASLEMTPDAMAMRALSEQTARQGKAVEYSSMRRGNMAEFHLASLKQAAPMVADLPISFLPRQYNDIGALSAGVKQLARRGDLRLIVVDYLQLMRSNIRGNTNEQVSDLSKSLKALAMQLELPILALSQLSRAVESREDKRPVLSDLRDSGSIEQDADTVMFCYRDEYYISREEPDGKNADIRQAWEKAMQKARNRLDIIVPKQRAGEIGTARVRCNPGLNLIWED